MIRRGSVDGDLTDPFPVTNGVKPGSVLAPSLFGLFLAMMVEEALHGSANSIFRCFCTDKLFNLSHLHMTTKVIEAFFQEPLYTDECALVTRSYKSLCCAAHNFGLTIS